MQGSHVDSWLMGLPRGTKYIRRCIHLQSRGMIGYRNPEGGMTMPKPKTKSLSKCAECGLEISERICKTPDGKGSKNCPTLLQKEILAEANREID
jgi:hypothetical protein